MFRVSTGAGRKIVCAHVSRLLGRPSRQVLGASHLRLESSPRAQSPVQSGIARLFLSQRSSKPDKSPQSRRAGMFKRRGRAGCLICRPSLNATWHNGANGSCSLIYTREKHIPPTARGLLPIVHQNYSHAGKQCHPRHERPRKPPPSVDRAKTLNLFHPLTPPEITSCASGAPLVLVPAFRPRWCPQSTSPHSMHSPSPFAGVSTDIRRWK